MNNVYHCPFDLVTNIGLLYIEWCSSVLNIGCCVSIDLDPVVLIPKDTHVIAQGEELMATCNAQSSLPTHTVWFKVNYSSPLSQTLYSYTVILDYVTVYFIFRGDLAMLIFSIY